MLYSRAFLCPFCDEATRAPVVRWRKTVSLIEKRWRPTLRIRQTKFATQHGEELWQGIDACVVQELTEPCPALLQPGQRSIRIMLGSAEGKHVKAAAARCDTAVSFENRAQTFKPDCQRDQEHERRGEEEKATGEHNVCKTSPLIPEVRGMQAMRWRPIAVQKYGVALLGSKH
jgi:hypothetical protein